ncbi:MAG TPA: response regulator [Nitrospirota bacterium]|nr:response regulator [Nitrospirota bacterium]
MSDRQIRTILLVDSSASIIFYLAMLLRRLEYKVMTARSAEEALRIMETETPSLVLTEVSLPQMSGMQLLKTIKDSARLKAIPVVILTMDKDPGMKNACALLGSAGFLNKPVEPDVPYRSLQSVTESTPRANIRISASLKVIVGDSSEIGDAVRTEYATAISEGGVYIKTLYPHPRDALTRLRIFIHGQQINARAVVLYSFSKGDGRFQEPGMGMKFVELSDGDRALIRSFIKEQLTGDLGTPA